MDTYEEVMSSFMHHQLPTLPVRDCERFEAVVAEVIGSKQRRQGPMPSPEVQVAIRDYVRQNNVLHFFVPWSGSKVKEGTGVDVLEFMAIKHLSCLKEGLKRLGVDSVFHFRLEDTTDFYLCAGRDAEVKEYVDTMSKLATTVLDGRPVLESSKVDIKDLGPVADDYARVFYGYLTGGSKVSSIQGLGWKGEICQEQRDYYYDAYNVFYPKEDPVKLLSEYFAITLLRINMGMTCLPKEPVIQISFTRPVPGNPVGRNRLYYRTMPTSYSCKNSAPWVRNGYFLIDSQNNCCPKYVEDSTVDLNEAVLDFNGIKIQTPYVLG